MIERLQHRFRLLRGRRIVEIGEALAAHRFLEDRELSSDRVQIEWQWLFSMAVRLLACAPMHAASPIALRWRSAPSWADGKSGVEGTRVYGRVVLGGCRNNKEKKEQL